MSVRHFNIRRPGWFFLLLLFSLTGWCDAPREIHDRIALAERLKHVKAGDILIAHMNKPASESAEGLAPALSQLLRQGFVFVRLDQIEIRAIP